MSGPRFASLIRSGLPFILGFSILAHPLHSQMDMDLEKAGKEAGSLVGLLSKGLFAGGKSFESSEMFCLDSFDKADTDRNGIVTSAELGIPGGSPKMAADLDELMGGGAESGEEPEGDLLDQAVDQAEKMNIGAIDPEQIRKLNTNLGESFGSNEMLNLFDANQDGSVTAQELRQGIESRPDCWDSHQVLIKNSMSLVKLNLGYSCSGTERKLLEPVCSNPEFTEVIKASGLSTTTEIAQEDMNRVLAALSVRFLAGVLAHPTSDRSPDGTTLPPRFRPEVWTLVLDQDSDGTVSIEEIQNFFQKRVGDVFGQEAANYYAGIPFAVTSSEAATSPAPAVTAMEAHRPSQMPASIPAEKTHPVSLTISPTSAARPLQLPKARAQNPVVVPHPKPSANPASRSVSQAPAASASPAAPMSGKIPIPTTKAALKPATAALNVLPGVHAGSQTPTENQTRQNVKTLFESIPSASEQDDLLW